MPQFSVANVLYWSLPGRSIISMESISLDDGAWTITCPSLEHDPLEGVSLPAYPLAILHEIGRIDDPLEGWVVALHGMVPDHVSITCRGWPGAQIQRGEAALDRT